MPNSSIKRFLTALLLLLAFGAKAPQPIFAQKTKIKMERANSMKGLKVNGVNVVRYIGDVRFSYNDTRITCDSAYLNSAANYFDAQGHVVIKQTNTTITGDKLHFDGNTSWATIWGKEVVMIDDNTRLVTDQLKYNSRQKYAYFYTKGVVTSDDITLTSKRGYLYNEQNKVIFADNVVMKNPNGNAFTDSLSYFSSTKLVDFYGPSFLFYDSSFIYCEHGNYNINLRQATASKKAYLINKTQKLFGNRIFFDDSTGYADVTGNVMVADTSSNIFVYGQHAQYWRGIGRAKVSKNPYVAMIDSKDTLFLKADTLFVDEHKNPTLPDSTYNLIRGIGGVQFFRHDVQGHCDSLHYSTLDSIMLMHGKPVLWQENSQMTADIIKGYSKKGTIDKVDFSGNAFIAMEEEPLIYNQLRGKSIVALFNSKGSLYQVDVDGNGQAVYYMRDNNAISMVNRAESAHIVIKVKNNKVSKITFMSRPKSNLYPIEMAEPEDVTLKGFRWQNDIRPKNKYSILPKNFILKPIETGASRREFLRKTINGEPINDIKKTIKADEKNSKNQPKNQKENPKKKERKGLFSKRK